MKIVAVEVLPFEAGGKIGSSAYRRTHAAVKVVTDEGLTGISRIGPEAGPYVEQTLAPELLGQDPANVERLWERMYAAVPAPASPGRARWGWWAASTSPCGTCWARRSAGRCGSSWGACATGWRPTPTRSRSSPGASRLTALAEAMARYVDGGFGRGQAPPAPRRAGRGRRRRGPGA